MVIIACGSSESPDGRHSESGSGGSAPEGGKAMGGSSGAATGGAAIASGQGGTSSGDGGAIGSSGKGGSGASGGGSGGTVAGSGGNAATTGGAMGGNAGSAAGVGPVGGGSGADPGTCELGANQGLNGTLDGEMVSLNRPGDMVLLKDEAGAFYATDLLGQLGALFYIAGADLAADGEHSLTNVLFRMPPKTSQSDVFFCAGPSSTFARCGDGGTMVLRDLSRVGKCSEFGGSDTASLDYAAHTFEGTLDGTPFARTLGSGSAGQEANNVKRYVFDYTTSMPIGLVTFLADSDLGMKTGVPLVEPYWFESSGGEPLVMCGGPDSTGSATSYELDGVSAEFLGAGRLPACPGTPVDGELSAVLQELKYFGGP